MFCVTHQRRAESAKAATRWGLFALFAALVGVSLTVRGAAPEEAARREYAIAGFKPPPRWDLLPRDRPSYPQLLGWASRGQGNDRAVITLLGKRLPGGTTLQEFAQEALGLRAKANLANLRVQIQSASGWFGNQRIQIDAALTADGPEKHPQALRQILLLNPPFGYVLTLLAPQEQAPARYRDLDDTFSNLVPLPSSSTQSDAGVISPADAGASPKDAAALR